MIGQRFGQLTVIDVIKPRTGSGLSVVVRCDCGQERAWKSYYLTSGRRTSCGHTKLNGNVQDHPLYERWHQIMRRCQYGNKDSPRYHGRGITVCERWLEFRNFLADMGPTYQPGLTIERIDNNGPYAPENCIWATPKEQARNRRSNVIVPTPWGDMSIAEAAERRGINYWTLWDRWRRWDRWGSEFDNQRDSWVARSGLFR